jgi:methyl-accepting chemotaxis protein
MFKSLKSKIIASMITVTSVCVISFASISVYEIKETVTKQMKNDGANLANAINREVDQYILNDLKSVEKIFKQIKEQSNNNIKYISLIDENSNIIASSEILKSEENKNLDSVSSASKKGTSNEKDNKAKDETMESEDSSGYFFETENGDKVYNVSTELYQNNKLIGTMGIGVSLSVMNSMIFESLIKIIIMSLVVIIIANILGILIAKNITDPIKKIIDKLDDSSKGDFTIEFEDDNKVDDTKKLTDALNKSIIMLKKMIVETKKEVSDLVDISSYLKVSSESVTSSSRNVSEVVTEVAQGTEEQSYNANQVTEILTSFSESLYKVLDRVENTVQISTKIENSSDIGVERLESLISSIDEVRTSFDSTSLSIKHLNSDANKIGEIMNVINDVAKQTNLLALNAAIEAARAGETGKGFSIIADEIRKLAEKVMHSSESINKIISSILYNIDWASNTSKDISIKMDNQMEVIDNTKEAFNSIQFEVHTITSEFKDISSSLKDTVKEQDLILSSTEEVSVISGQIASSTQQISASVQENAATMEELSNLADKIDGMTVRINENLNNFIV